MSLPHSQAEKWHPQAKGATGQQTALTLISWMDTTAHRAQAEVGDLNKTLRDFHPTTWDFSLQVHPHPAQRTDNGLPLVMEI